MKNKRSGSSLTAFAMLSKNKIMKKKKKKHNLSLSDGTQNVLVANISTASTSEPQPMITEAVSLLSQENEPTSAVSNNQDESSDNKNSKQSDSFEGQKTFEWLIYPILTAQFFDEVWEKKAFVVKRKNRDYYKGLFSCKDLDRILREKPLQFTTDIDLTTYRNGLRETHNADGRAYAAVVWDHYQTGCSVRLLKPQTYVRSVWKLCSILQDYFGSFVGGNVYLTPAGSQGFAPHYDDIEAFVLQLEGKKHWKVYRPRDQSLELPRFSSGNFSDKDDLGEEVIDIVLLPGDLLYFPKGFIHHAKTTEGEHSLHLTLSTAQRNTWGDLFEKLIPRALELAFEEDIDYRQSLPRNYMSFMGVSNCDKECTERDLFLKNVKVLTERLSKYLSTDAGIDQMAKNFIHGALPPVITNKERNCSIHGNGEYWENGGVRNAVELDFDSSIRVIRKMAIRIVMEEGGVRIYHSMENTRVYQEVKPQYFEVAVDLIPAVEFLLDSYPEFVTVSELPLGTMEDKMELANLLYDKGLLVTDVPLTEPEDS